MYNKMTKEQKRVLWEQTKLIEIFFSTRLFERKPRKTNTLDYMDKHPIITKQMEDNYKKLKRNTVLTTPTI
jgi:hypothetical protein